MMEEGNSCLFRDVVDICSIEKVYESNELTEIRRQKVIECSHQRMDSFASQLNESHKKYHTQCYLYYTSKQKIKRHVEKESSVLPKQPPAKKKR